MQEGQREELKEGEEEEEGEEAMTAMFSQQANGNFRNPCEESTRRLGCLCLFERSSIP